MLGCCQTRSIHTQVPLFRLKITSSRLLEHLMGHISRKQPQTTTTALFWGRVVRLVRCVLTYVHPLSYLFRLMLQSNAST